MKADAIRTDGWQLAGNSAAVCERYLVPALFARSAEGLLDVACVTAGDRVLGVACGTGIVNAERLCGYAAYRPSLRRATGAASQHNERPPRKASKRSLCP